MQDRDTRLTGTPEPVSGRPAGLADLYWLPEDPAFDDTLRLVRHADDEFPALMPALMRLAGSRLDFLRSGRVDRIAQQHLHRCGGAAPGVPRLRLALLASNTVEHLLPAIRVAGLRRGLLIDCYVASYGQYRQELSDPGSPLHAFAPDVVLFSLDARAMIAELPLTTPAQDVRETVAAAVDEVRSLWRLARERLGAAVIQQTVLDTALPLFGGFESHVAAAPARLTQRCNQALTDAAVEDAVLLFDLAWWAAQSGTRQLADPMLWHQAKQEISPALAPLVGDLLGRQLAAVRGLSRKCLVLDLDNTLWGGVIGDDGLEGIVLGQGSALGEAFAAFQHYVKRLSERGIALAVSSKNEQAIAEAAFERHPEMVLRRSDIAAFEANWHDKPAAVQRIARDLNLGLDALVFFDDNPAERALMRQTLPAVAVPEVPEAVEAYPRCLADAGYFEAVAFTSDDARRTEQYVANSERRRIQSAAADMDGFLRDLDMELKVGAFDRLNLPRITQLINKTNQFNLTTRRYTEAEVAEMAADPALCTFHGRLVDRFGDNGIITVVIGRLAETEEETVLDIDTWLMSCRVLGRRVEQAMLDLIAQAAAAAGAAAIVGRYLPTPKNALVKNHYADLGFTVLPQAAAEDGETRWRLSLAGYTPRRPDVIKVVMADE